MRTWRNCTAAVHDSGTIKSKSPQPRATRSQQTNVSSTQALPSLSFNRAKMHRTEEVAATPVVTAGVAAPAAPFPGGSAVRQNHVTFFGVDGGRALPADAAAAVVPSATGRRTKKAHVNSGRSGHRGVEMGVSFTSDVVIKSSIRLSRRALLKYGFHERAK